MPSNLPETTKINEKPLVFLCFLLLSHIAQDGIKTSENTPRKLPRSLQDSPKPLQDPPKTLQDGPKTPPRRSPDALKRSQGAFQTRPGRTRIAPDIPKPSNTPPRPLQSSIFEGLGDPKLRFYLDFLKLPSDSLLEASKPLSIQYGDGGMRGAFE